MQTSDVKIQREPTASYATEISGPSEIRCKKQALLMNLILERLRAADFQTELLVMTLLGLVNCTLNFCRFDWTTPAEKINKVPMSSKYSEEIKTVLRWIVIARMIINHMDFATYLGNLYSVVTWCRPNLLVPSLIIGALKNFILEFISFAVVVLLYLENNFPSVLFIEFIVERVIAFVPAAYYWCCIKELFVVLSQILQRKITRANIIANWDANATRLATTSSDNFTIERKKIKNFANFDEVLSHSSLELDGDREQYRQTVSLTTLRTMEEDSTLPENSSLTPAEKAMRILGLNIDDINAVRIRLGKSALTNYSGVEEKDQPLTQIHATDLPNFTYNVMNNVRPHDVSLIVDKIERNDDKQTNVNSKVVEETSQKPPKRCTCEKSNYASKDVDLTKDVENTFIPNSKESEKIENKEDDILKRNQDFDQTEIKISESTKDVENTFTTNPDESENNENKEVDDISRINQALHQTMSDRLKFFGPSVFWSIDFPRRGIYKVDEDFSDGSYDVDIENSKASEVPATEFGVNHSHESSVTSQKDLKKSDSLADYSKRESVELFAPKISSNSSATSNQHEKNFENETNGRTSLEIEIQTEFHEDFRPNTLQASRSAQTSVNNIWMKLESIEKSLRVNANRPPLQTVDVPRSKPQDLPIHPRKIMFAGITTGIAFARTRKIPESPEEREAREMRALRVYNRLTLLKDKREMEMKKINSVFRNRAGTLGSFFQTDMVNVPSRDMDNVRKSQQSLESKKVQNKINQVPKRLTRSRPQEKTSKLSTFNLGLDDLENSISLSFSSENKNRSKLHRAKNNFHQSPPNSQQEGKKQLSKHSKPAKSSGEINVPSSSTMRIEGPQTGRDLQRTIGVEDISRGKGNIIRVVSEKIFSETTSSSLESLHTEQQNPKRIDEYDNVERNDWREISRLKESINNIDWRFHGHTSSIENVVHRENDPTSRENVLYDIIDDTDTITQLQSAFASNPGNTERGFYLAPGSTELYSVSNFLDDVVEEIMKTTRLRPNPDVFTVESTNEVDYGDWYLQQFERATFLAIDNSDEETSMDSISEAEKSIEQVESANVHSVPSKPVEMCWNSYSREGTNVRVDPQPSIVKTDVVNPRTEKEQPDSQKYEDKLKNLESSQSITKILGEQEISHVEYWARRLKDLASLDQRDDFELRKEFRHLTKLPGFCVIKMLVDFFRDFVAVSRSTMTSRMFLGGNRNGSTPSNVGSEELILGHINATSNTSVVNDSPNIQNNLEPDWVIDNEVADALQVLVDRLMEITDTGNPPNYPVNEVYDDRSTFPLREDQFYFGPPGTTRRLVQEILTYKHEVPDSRAIDRENTLKEIDTYIKTQPPFVVQRPTTSFIFGASSNTQNPSQNCDQDPTKKFDPPIEFQSTSESFDSLYSASRPEISTSSHNVSIGAESSFEEFADDNHST